MLVPIKRRPYTPAEIEQIKKIAADGGKLSDYARATGRSPRAIRQFCDINGIKRGNKPRTKWTPEIVAKVLDLRQAGLTFRAIAEQLGVSKSALNTHIAKLSTAKPRPISRKAKPQARVKHQRRTCLSCAKPFISWGPGNRMCNGCRNNHASLGAGSYAI